MIVVVKRYSWTLHFLTIALASYLVAQAFSTYIASKLESMTLSKPEAEAPKQELAPEEETAVDAGIEEDAYKVIAERNIFNSAATGIAEENPIVEDPTMLGELGPAVKTGLSVKLLGTLVVDGGADRRSSATVKGGGKKEIDVYYVGDEKSFGENVRLTKVMKDRIEFVNGSRLEYAELEDFAQGKSIFDKAEAVHGDRKSSGSSKGGASVSDEGGAIVAQGDKIFIDQSAIDDALTNLDRFYTEIRIVPHFDQGKVSGMKVLSVKPGSLVSKLGLQRGDILEKINGQELDVKRGMALFAELKDQKNFSIDLKRGGQNKTLEYEIR
ncbi:MAG: hypothetical protein HY539_04685 [Deltaproteobacteria bacterium]|nr:hypothetical protein [Deltaproteobacteria bacterium]